MREKRVSYDSSEYVLFYDKENPDNGYLITREIYSMTMDQPRIKDDETVYFVEAFELKKIREERQYDEYAVDLNNTSIEFPVNRIQIPIMPLVNM